MKKIIVTLFIFVISITMMACKDDSSAPIVISKLYTSTRQANNIIELYNNSDDDINLGSYKILFYTNASHTVSQEIALSGTISANSYYAIGSENHGDLAIVAQFDFKYNASLPYNGNDVVALAKGSKTIDVCGTIGSDVDFSRNLTLIRIGQKEDYQPADTYYAFNYIMYLPDLYEYLKNDNYEIKTIEQIYQGPRLEDRYKEMPYVDENDATMGGGGAAEVTLGSIADVADGDTARFVAANGFPGVESSRYYYINTPEVDGGYVVHEAWGYVASKYNKEYLLNNSSSKTIHVQSIKGISLRDSTSSRRYLSLVWINGELSQFLIVAEGLSESVPVTYVQADLEMSYKQIPYLTFLRFAEQRAVENGWGVFGYPSNPDGEKAPDWDYNSNSTATQNPKWTPHLPLNW